MKDRRKKLDQETRRATKNPQIRGFSCVHTSPLFFHTKTEGRDIVDLRHWYIRFHSMKQ